MSNGGVLRGTTPSGQTHADASRGLVPNFVKIVPSMAVSFYTFDTIHDLLARWANEEDEEEYEA